MKNILLNLIYNPETLAVLFFCMMLVSFSFASCKFAVWFWWLELPKADPFTAFRASPAVLLMPASVTFPFSVLSPIHSHSQTGPVVE